MAEWPDFNLATMEELKKGKKGSASGADIFQFQRQAVRVSRVLLARAPVCIYLPSPAGSLFARVPTHISPPAFLLMGDLHTFFVQPLFLWTGFGCLFGLVLGPHCGDCRPAGRRPPPAPPRRPHLRTRLARPGPLPFCCLRPFPPSNFRRQLDLSRCPVYGRGSLFFLEHCSRIHFNRNICSFYGKPSSPLTTLSKK